MLREASYSRIYQHTRDNETFAIIGSEDKDTHKSRYEELKSLIKKYERKYGHLGYNRLSGTYQYKLTGEITNEKSVIIYGISKKDALSIAREINQESIIWKENTFFGIIDVKGTILERFKKSAMNFSKAIKQGIGSRLQSDQTRTLGYAFEGNNIRKENKDTEVFKMTKKKIIKEGASLEKQISKYLDCDYEELEEQDFSSWDAYDLLQQAVEKYPGNKKAEDFIKEVEEIEEEQPDEDPFEILDYGTYDILMLADDVVNKELKESEEIRDPNNLTKEQLWKLRQEIVLGSIYVSDYENSFGIEPIDVCNFFDSFLEEENSDEYGYPLKEERKMSEYDNAEDLYNYYSSCENPFGEQKDVGLYVNGKVYWEGKRYEITNELLLDVADQATEEEEREIPYDSDEVDIIPLDEAEEPNDDVFKNMVMELHGYVEADPKRISQDLKQAIKGNVLNNYLKSNATMTDDEIKAFKEKYKLNESEKDLGPNGVKEQIRFMCKFSDIPVDEDFVNFVYNKHLDAFSGEIMKKLKKEYDKSKTKKESEETIQKRKLEDCPEDVKTAVYDFLYNNYGPSKVDKIEKILDDIKYEEYGTNNENLGFIYVNLDGKEYKLDIDGNPINESEELEVSDLKKKALEILPKEDIDTHDGDLYIKKTPDSTALLSKVKNINSGLLSTFRNQQTGEIWYDIPFANWEDDYKEKTGRDFNESEELYVFSNAQSEDKSDADSWVDVYSREAPNLDFKVSKRGNMYFVDFIGSKEDIINYIKKLDWFNDDEIEEYDLIKPLNKMNEAEEETPKRNDIDIQVYMNTWKNYNEYGADLEAYGIKDGWMSPEEGLEFCNKYAEDEPFINDVDNNTGLDLEISEYDNAPTVLQGLVKLNEVLNSEHANIEADELPLLYEAWSDRESVSTPSLENINAFIDFVENGEYYVHPDIKTTYDIGEYYVDNVGFEGVQGIENYIDSDRLKEEWQEEIDGLYLDDDGNPTEDWYEVDDYMVSEDIENLAQSNNKQAIEQYFDYESLGEDIYNDGYWYLSDDGAVEIY